MASLMPPCWRPCWISNCPAGQPRHRAKDREFRAKHKGRMSQGSVAIGSTERVCWGIKGTVLFRKPRISQSKTQSLVEDHFSVILVWCCTICGFQSSLYNVFRSVKPSCSAASRPCMYYDHSTCMCYDHSTCMYYGQSWVSRTKLLTISSMDKFAYAKFWNEQKWIACCVDEFFS